MCDAQLIGIQANNPPYSMILRNNDLLHCGSSGIDAGIRFAGSNSVITGNRAFDCQNGNVLTESAGAYGSDTQPQLDGGVPIVGEKEMAYPVGS